MVVVVVVVVVAQLAGTAADADTAEEESLPSGCSY